MCNDGINVQFLWIVQLIFLSIPLRTAGLALKSLAAESGFCMS